MLDIQRLLGIDPAGRVQERSRSCRDQGRTSAGPYGAWCPRVLSGFPLYMAAFSNQFHKTNSIQVIFYFKLSIRSLRFLTKLKLTPEL